ncbi:MAG TPA: response regulator, partial [Vicinamibacteria bacterium]|nr:response regulator [Vicinamibacteria bacterium]
MQAVPHRIVLVIDEDAAFRDRLASLLAPLGVRIEFVQGEDAVLEALGRRPPEAVFIAVDLPDKQGYALFSKVKKARRRVPVALVTATIFASDLKLHEKLKIHAEVYLDKRLATDDDLREAIESRLGISPRGESGPAVEAPDLEREAAPVRPGPDAASAVKATIEPWLAELLDPETTAILAEIDEDASLSGAPRKRTADGEVSAERVQELEEELALAREELGQARRDARSSPFSSEFLVLREEASAKDKRLRAVQEALGRRDSQFAVVKARLTDFARNLLEARREAEASREQVSDLKGELEAAQGKLQRLFDDVEEHERRHDDDAKSLRQQLTEAQARHAEARRAHLVELASLKSAHATARESRESEHQSAIEALEKKLKEQK